MNENIQVGKTSLIKKNNKEELADIILELRIEKEKMATVIKKYEVEIDKLKKENNRLSNSIMSLSDDDSKIKKILELRATNLATTDIKKRMDRIGITVSMEFIQDVIETIDTDLTPELRLYYNKCREDYSESIKINTKLYKQSSINEIAFLIDSCKLQLSKTEILIADGVGDDKIANTLSNLRKELSDYIKIRDNLMKNIDEAPKEDEEDEIANEATQQWMEESDKIIKFNDIQIKDKIG